MKEPTQEELDKIFIILYKTSAISYIHAIYDESSRSKGDIGKLAFLYDTIQFIMNPQKKVSFELKLHAKLIKHAIRKNAKKKFEGFTGLPVSRISKDLEL